MTSNLTVRLDDETREKLELIALREFRPLAGQINYFVQKGIEGYLDEHDLAIDRASDGTLSISCYRPPKGHKEYYESIPDLPEPPELEDNSQRNS